MEPDVSDWRPIPGETPIDPSHLRDRSITTRRELNQVEEHQEGSRQVFGCRANPEDCTIRLHPAVVGSERT